MIEINLHKAGGLTEVFPDSAVITIDKILPEIDESVNPIEDLFAYDAKELARALSASLPQGTMDRLLVEILKRKLSSFRGRMEDK